MNQEMVNKKKTLYKALKIIVAVFAGLILALGVLVLLDKCVGKEIDYQHKDDSIYYFSADYEENISEDIVYMAFNREVAFTDTSGFTRNLNEDNIKDSPVAELMYKYFVSLKNGDAESHSKLFTDEYKSNFVLQKKFTAQKVYNINISYLSSNDGKDIYRVVYKIYENNGSYRADIGSNVGKIMAFEIDKSNGSALINSIGYITDKIGG